MSSFSVAGSSPRGSSGKDAVAASFFRTLTPIIPSDIIRLGDIISIGVIFASPEPTPLVTGAVVSSSRPSTSPISSSLSLAFCKYPCRPDRLFAGRPRLSRRRCNPRHIQPFHRQSGTADSNARRGGAPIAATALACHLEKTCPIQLHPRLSLDREGHISPRSSASLKASSASFSVNPSPELDISSVSVSAGSTIGCENLTAAFGCNPRPTPVETVNQAFRLVIWFFRHVSIHRCVAGFCGQFHLWPDY